MPNWWVNRTRVKVDVTIGETRKSRFGANTLMDFDMRIACGDEMLTPDELRDLLEKDDASKGDIKAKLAAYRADRKAREAKLKKAQEDLRQLLTIKQEAQAVLSGLLN